MWRSQKIQSGGGGGDKIFYEQIFKVGGSNSFINNFFPNFQGAKPNVAPPQNEMVRVFPYLTNGLEFKSPGNATMFYDRALFILIIHPDSYKD